MRVERERTAPLKADAVSLVEWRRELVSRRSFLARMAGVSVAALFPLAATGTAQQADDWQELTDKPQAVLAAVQQHLLPSEPGIPGAREINALPWINKVLADPQVDGDERAFILNGIDWLESLVKDETGKSFTDLDATQREQMLRRIGQSNAGENWLSTIMTYLFEALLSDPAYGSNPNGIGWQWLEHQPGFPRPPTDKLYGKL